MHTSLSFVVVAAILALFVTGCGSVRVIGGRYDEASISVGGTTYRYVLRTPLMSSEQHAGHDLILFLHGKGECGTDNKAQLRVGLPAAARADEKSWPFVILIPQKPDAEKQWEDYEPALLAMIEKTRKEQHLEKSRLFLTGLSQGGHGTWILGARHPEMWTAIAPVCGYGNPAQIAPGLKSMPIFAVHGLADNVVAADQTRRITDAVRETGNTRVEARYYEGVGHNSWDKAYGEENLAAWFLRQRSK
jgi:predicted peptidase